MTGDRPLPSPPDRLEIWGLRWPEIAPGDDLVALLAAEHGLRDGDVLVVTSKVLSKAEGRLVAGDRAGAIAAQTSRVVASRGATVIAETPHGLVMAAAGVDASNTPPGTVLLLPVDPDASARTLRCGVYAATGRNIAVVVSDTAGRAWRVGQTDMAIGCAGLQPLHDLEGTHDTFGNELQVTAAAVADELAAAGDLVKAKTTGRPVAVVRGFAAAVLPPGEDGPGACALLREAASDFFGLGVREAVVAAARRTDAVALGHFPAAGSDVGPFLEVVHEWLSELSSRQRLEVRASLAPSSCGASDAAVWELRIDVPAAAVADDADADADLLMAIGRLLERADALAAAHRLTSHELESRSQPPGRAAADVTPGRSRRLLRRCFHPYPS